LDVLSGCWGGLLIGVAPQAHILNVKVLRNRPATAEELAQFGVPDTPFNRCRYRGTVGLSSWILQGILLANQQSADVISMSLGAYFARSFPGGAGGALWSAYNRVTSFGTSRGSVLLAVGGNDALNFDGIGPLVFTPADSPNVIAMMATTNPALLPPTPPERQPCSPGQDCLAFYSNFGSSLHGLAAPGGDYPLGGCDFSGSVCLPTGFLRGACSSGVPGTSEPLPAGYPATGPPPAGTSWGCFAFAGPAQHAWYAQALGTSGATPIAAGAAALIKSANPSLSPAQIRTILQRTAQDIGKVGYDSLFNYGMIDAVAAVQDATK
jgi:lantibiotic leader peptide-processing serine protease